MKDNRNTKKMTALVSLSVISVLSIFGLHTRNTRKVYPLIGETTPTTLTLYDIKTIKIIKADFNLDSIKNTDFSISKTIGESPVIYSGKINQISTSAGNPWLNIKKVDADNFTQASPSGSDLNKWHLTSIEFEYGAWTETVGNTNEIKVNDILIHSYEGVAESASLTNLNANKQTAKRDFDFDDNITTFSIDPTYNLYITYINLTYTIDYSIC